MDRFTVDINEGYDLNEVDAWVDAAMEYVNLLQDALDRAAGFLHVYGWHEDDAVVQRGKELRAILGIRGIGE